MHYGTVEKEVNSEPELCVAWCQPIGYRRIQVERTSLQAIVPKHLLGTGMYNPYKQLKGFHVPQECALYMLPVKPVHTLKRSLWTGGRGPIVSLSGRRGLCSGSGQKLDSDWSRSKVITDITDENSSKWSKVMNRFALRAQRNSFKSHWKHKDLLKLMKFDELWYAVYGKLTKNVGSTTQGVSDITIDGTTWNMLCEIRDQVISGVYQWGKTRRVFIPKPHGGERPLPDFPDRIVQMAIAFILEIIWEPLFHEESTGFRIGKSQHTAMRLIRKTFKRSIWVIEGDISQFFDTVHHQKLISILEKKIKVYSSYTYRTLGPNNLASKSRRWTSNYIHGCSTRRNFITITS